MRLESRPELKAPNRSGGGAQFDLVSSSVKLVKSSRVWEHTMNTTTLGLLLLVLVAFDGDQLFCRAQWQEGGGGAYSQSGLPGASGASAGAGAHGAPGSSDHGYAYGGVDSNGRPYGGSGGNGQFYAGATDEHGRHYGAAGNNGNFYGTDEYGRPVGYGNGGAGGRPGQPGQPGYNGDSPFSSNRNYYGRNGASAAKAAYALPLIAVMSFLVAYLKM